MFQQEVTGYLIVNQLLVSIGGQGYFPSLPCPEILSVSINNFIVGVTRTEGEIDKCYYPGPWSAVYIVHCV